jgi:deoxyribodipyrimidine photolyase-related protein
MAQDRGLILILGDQLTPKISSLKEARKERDVVLVAEVADEARYVKHHKKKIAFLFSAMRHFAEELRGAGWTVDYVALDAPSNSGSFRGEVQRAIERHRAKRIVVAEPGEWRLLEDFQTWRDDFGLPVLIHGDDRFICSRGEFQDWARDRKQLRMEFFYREMRRKTGLLMNGDEPEGGRWNFDSENRKPAKNDLLMPQPPRFAPNETTREVVKLVGQRFADHFGDLEPFWFATTREDAEKARDHFLEHALPFFGDFQDAMLMASKFLYHAVLSPYLNCGLLDALDLCRRAEKRYRAGTAPLNAVEGFIRQIIGWREYVRGIYWLKMPEYVSLNALSAKRRLPAFYWTGETEMNCMAHVVRQTREEAYAHHIQRLMVTGNFALLAGIDPREVHEWYLIVYADAYEWVELPNTLGMALFGDGGLLGSKPYSASGNYINRMSDYCGVCRYDVKQRTGPDACPFNALYWDFIARHHDRWIRNPRMVQIARNWSRFAPEEQRRISDQAKGFLDALAPSEEWP